MWRPRNSYPTAGRAARRRCNAIPSCGFSARMILTSSAPRLTVLPLSADAAALRQETTAPVSQAQRRPGEREVADRVCRIGQGRDDIVDLVPVLGRREVLGHRAYDRRPGFVEGRAVTLPAHIAGNAGVARTRGGIIIREFGDTVLDCAGGWGDVHREVGVGLGEGRTRDAVVACHRADNHRG